VEKLHNHDEHQKLAHKNLSAVQHKVILQASICIQMPSNAQIPDGLAHYKKPNSLFSF
jgi:hypothetical protein